MEMRMFLAIIGTAATCGGSRGTEPLRRPMTVVEATASTIASNVSSGLVVFDGSTMMNWP